MLVIPNGTESLCVSKRAAEMWFHKSFCWSVNSNWVHLRWVRVPSFQISDCFLFGFLGTWPPFPIHIIRAIHRDCRLCIFNLKMALYLAVGCISFFLFLNFAFSGYMRNCVKKKAHLLLILMFFMSHWILHLFVGMGIDKNLAIPAPLSISLIDSVPYRFSSGYI